MKFKGEILLLIVAGLLVGKANATEAYVTTEVVRTIVTDDDQYGGCMFEPSTSLYNQWGLDCSPGEWVSLDCAGVYGTKNAGQRKWDAVVLAEMLGTTIEVRIDDTQKIDRYCVAQRVRTIAD